jgi:signal transduction histidine kinase
MALLGSLNLLEKRLPKDEKTARLLANAIQAAERGAALTQRLLAFSRRQELKPEAVDFLKLFDNIQDLLSRALGPGIDVRKQIPLRIPPLLVGSNQLELALLNLFVNARDAMPDGGTITVSAAENDVSRPTSLMSGRYVRISVSDNGKGWMKRPHLAQRSLFSPRKVSAKGQASAYPWSTVSPRNLVAP